MTGRFLLLVTLLFAGSATAPASADTATVPATQTHKFSVTGVADNTLIIGHFASANPDCTSSGKTFVRVSRRSGHGVITMREGIGFTYFAKMPQCNSTKLQGVTVEYLPERGYTGSDEFELDVISQFGGSEALVTYAITVKPLDYSDTLTEDFLKEKEWARADSLKMRNDDTHSLSTKQTQWPAVDDFLALRAAPSSNFRIQDNLPFEAAPASREPPDPEAQDQVTAIMKPLLDSSKAITATTPSESPASPPTAPKPPGWSAEAIPPEGHTPMPPGVAPPARTPLQTADELPQYKFAREVEHSPVAGGNAESRYLTVVYGMTKAHVRETPELRLDSANKRGVVDFYVDQGGNLVGRKLISSSGSPNLDMAVMTAIAAAAPFPTPPDSRPLYLTYNFGRR